MKTAGWWNEIRSDFYRQIECLVWLILLVVSSLVVFGCAPPGSRYHPIYGHANPLVGMCPKQQCPKQCPKEKKQTFELETVPHVGP